ncbi:MAG: hypothetical protein ACREIW_13370 [Chthoniobacterales bacterium]
MEEDVHQMMSARPETKKPEIQHVRKPRYRMPVTDLGESKRPQNSFASKSGSNGWILINVDIVIIVDESMPNGLAECDPDDRHQKNAGTLDNRPFAVEEVVPPKTFRADRFPIGGIRSTRRQAHQKAKPSLKVQRAEVSAQSRFAATEVLPANHAN